MGAGRRAPRPSRSYLRARRGSCGRPRGRPRPRRAARSRPRPCAVLIARPRCSARPTRRPSGRAGAGAGRGPDRGALPVEAPSRRPARREPAARGRLVQHGPAGVRDRRSQVHGAGARGRRVRPGRRAGPPRRAPRASWTARRRDPAGRERGEGVAGRRRASRSRAVSAAPSAIPTQQAAVRMASRARAGSRPSSPGPAEDVHHRRSVEHDPVALGGPQPASRGTSCGRPRPGAG